jgi:hypothetical protein
MGGVSELFEVFSNYSQNNETSPSPAFQGLKWPANRSPTVRQPVAGLLGSMETLGSSMRLLVLIHTTRR